MFHITPPDIQGASDYPGSIELLLQMSFVVTGRLARHAVRKDYFEMDVLRQLGLFLDKHEATS